MLGARRLDAQASSFMIALREASSTGTVQAGVLASGTIATSVHVIGMMADAEQRRKV